MKLPPIDLDARTLMDNAELSVLVYVRRTWRIRLGLLLIRWGCRITGMHYKECQA